MRVSYRWLQEYVDIEIGAAELADRLTMVGLTVDEVRRLDEGLTEVSIGRVESVKPHPDADQLVVCRIEWGEGREAQVVTGAPNVKEGAIIPFVRPGSHLPDGMTIEAAELRGVRSEGMMCSERELGLGEDHAGILLLPEGTPVGASLVEALSLRDDVIEIDVYPNRADCLGVIGVAREVAAILDKPLHIPEAPVEEADMAVERLACVKIAADDLCLRYSGRVLREVAQGPSPLWMQQRLRSVGMRPINNVVDVTNYVMWETGQPLHAFDHAKLQGGRIEVRRARDGEEMQTLDGKERTLDADMLVIADTERPAAIAGVMGGFESEVTVETKDILLESAVFSPESVRRTSRRMGLRSEASHRFEKGLPVSGTLYALERAASLLQQVAGAKVTAGQLDRRSREAPSSRQRTLSLRPGRVNRLLGTRIDSNEMAGLLRRLEFDVQSGHDASAHQVGIPAHRRDVEREADLIEEVARLYGYDAIPPTLPKRSGRGADSPEGRLASAVRTSMVASGLSEHISYSFIDPASLERLGLGADDPRRHAIPLRNPLAPEMSVMRTTLVPGLLEAVARNVHRQQERVWLYEVGGVFLADGLPLTKQPEERLHLGLAMVGDASPRSPHEAARNVDFYDLKGVLERLFEALRCPVGFGAPESEETFLHPGRAAVPAAGGEPGGDDGEGARAVGWCGELHPEVTRSHDIPGRVYAAEIDLKPVWESRLEDVRFRPLPRYPAVVRDLALLSPVETPARRIEERIRAAGGPLVQGVRLFDQYEGNQIPEGKKSLAYSITYRAPDRTLKDDEVAQVERRVADALYSELRISLRG